MKEFKKLAAILAELDTLAEKADRFKAQREANVADDERGEEIWKEYTEQAARDKANKTRARVLCLNAAYYITTQVMPEAAEIWNSYTGKRIGEKKREEIRSKAHDLAKAARLDYILFYNDHVTARFSYKNKTYYDFNGEPDGSGAAYFSIDYWNDGDGARLNLYDESGRAAAINLNGLKKYGDYIGDVDAFIKEAEKARELIETKKRELKQAQHAAAIYSEIFDPYNI